MNISTVLTSIRLLLSEPNPDDALMAETVSISDAIHDTMWLQQFNSFLSIVFSEQGIQV